jgi:hypothetical protein
LLASSSSSPSISDAWSIHRLSGMSSQQLRLGARLQPGEQQMLHQLPKRAQQWSRSAPGRQEAT